MYGPSRRLSRRVFLRHAGTAAALIPLVSVTGCSDDSSAPADAAADQATSQPSTPAPAAEPGGEQPSDGGSMPRLAEDDPTAQALGYRHDAADVDAESHPRLQPGQTCSDCALYQSEQGTEQGWGGCSIFPGRLVNGAGWCSAYVPA